MVAVVDVDFPLLHSPLPAQCSLSGLWHHWGVEKVVACLGTQGMPGRDWEKQLMP